MILSLCLNPAIDKSIYLDEFLPGQTNRSKGEAQKPGGKGINCAVILAGMGVKSAVACFMSNSDEVEIAPVLQGRGCKLKTVHIDERLRFNLKIINKSLGEVTEINASGAKVSAQQLEEMTGLVKDLAPLSDWVLLTGSLPPGCPDSYYASLMRLIRQTAPSANIALDAGGEAFRLALQEKPDLIKPNMEELSIYLGHPVTNRQEALLGAERLDREGTGDIIISMGSIGALLYAKQARAFSPALTLPVVSTVGAGDAMLSGYVAGKVKKLCDLDAFRMALASAALSVIGQKAEPFMMDEWMQRFDIENLV